MLEFYTYFADTKFLNPSAFNMNLHNILFFWTGTRQNAEYPRGHNGLENIIRVAGQCSDHQRRARTGRIFVILAVFATGKKAGGIRPDPPLRNLRVLDNKKCGDFSPLFSCLDTYFFIFTKFCSALATIAGASVINFPFASALLKQ